MSAHLRRSWQHRGGRVPDEGFSGLTIRLFDPERLEWSLYWVSSRSPVIDPPVVGRFTDGVGLFYCDDTFNGTPIRCRYTWRHISSSAARWEQAFSADGEATWETNWVNDVSLLSRDQYECH